MKGCNEHIPLSGRNDGAILQSGQYFHARPDSFNDWCAYEDCPQRWIAKRSNGQVCFEGLELAAKGVSPDDKIHNTNERLVQSANVPGQEYRAGACAEDRHAGSDAAMQGFKQAAIDHQFTNGCAFPSRYNETVDLGKLVRQSNFDGLDRFDRFTVDIRDRMARITAQLFEKFAIHEVTLEG
jgi:hypothetical protein